tara:strand:+ start:930 stop:1358 length:429 start_codon:yes stop_codon:yes gene_type:complete
MSKFDSINESLDIEVVDQAKDVIKESKKELKKLEREKPDSIRDYEYTRGNLYSLIEKGQEALDSILEVAQEGQQPRAYEVVSQLLKNVADTTDKLIELQLKTKELNAEEKKGPSTVNNALFVGSTAELQKLLKNGINEDNSK